MMGLSRPETGQVRRLVRGVLRSPAFSPGLPPGAGRGASADEAGLPLDSGWEGCLPEQGAGRTTRRSPGPARVSLEFGACTRSGP